MQHHLLWTSGWDSTFRLLDLLVVKRHSVQPYYLLDSSRRSTYAELRAMTRIREKVFDQYPYTKELLLKTKFFEVSSLQPNERISQVYHQTKQKIHIGAQYEWLALFTEEHQIKLEISVEKGLPKLKNEKPDWAEVFIEGHIITDLSPEGELINKLAATSVIYELFKYFEFPIIKMTKLDCGEYATKHNFRNMMELTWFCHFPIDDQPCGSCAACKQTIRYGFAYRIPFRGKMRYHLYNFKQLIKQLIKKLLK